MRAQVRSFLITFLEDWHLNEKKNKKEQQKRA
jgi:hypothetical protein